MTLYATITCYILGHNPRPVPDVSIQDDIPDGPWMPAIVCARCGKELRPL